MRKYQIFMLLVAMFLVAGCGDKFVRNSANLLEINKELYDANLNIAGDLYAQGIIQENEKEKAIEYGTTYMVVHNEAVGALEVYKVTESEDARSRFYIILSDVFGRMAELVDYVTGLKGE